MSALQQQVGVNRGSTWRSKRTGRVVDVNAVMELSGVPEVQVSYERDGKGWLKWLSLRGFLRDYELVGNHKYYHCPECAFSAGHADRCSHNSSRSNEGSGSD